MTTDHQPNPNQHLFDELLSENVITRDEYDRAMAIEPEPNLDKPGKALVWMKVADAISIERFFGLFDELAESRRTGVQQGSARRAAIIADADDVRARVLAAGAAADAQRSAAGWKWMAGLLVVGGAALWLFVRPAEVPGCTDPAVTTSLNRMFRAADSAAGLSMPRLPSGEELKTTIARVSEVGYAAGSRTRACKGAVTMGGVEEPYGFTIAMNGNRSSDFEIAGASVEMIEARYGHLDADGHVVNDAAPIGRVALEKAFRAGVAANQDKTVQAMRGMQILADAKRSPEERLSRAMNKRNQEIADLEPVAPCRERQPGTAYSCRLVVERNDPLLAAMGGASGGGLLTILDSEFTFERDGTAGEWRVSPAFREEFGKAVLAARTKLMNDKP